MSILDAAFGDLAATLLDEVQLGSRAATIRRPGAGGTYDPATSTVTGAASATDYPCRVAHMRFETTQIPESLIEEGDKAVFVSRKTLGITPVADSDVYIEGANPDAAGAVRWTIKGVHPVASGDLDAGYELHLRR